MIHLGPLRIAEAPALPRVPFEKDGPAKNIKGTEYVLR